MAHHIPPSFCMYLCLCNLLFIRSGSKCKSFWLFSRLTYAFGFCSIGLMDGLTSQDFHESIKKKNSLGSSSAHASSNQAVLPVYQGIVETLVTRPGKTVQNKTPSQDTLSGMFTPNYSLGIYCPTSFLDRFSVSEFLYCLHLDFVFSLSTFHLFWGCGSNITLEYLLSKQYEEKRKLSPTRKLDNGIRCLCLFH